MDGVVFKGADAVLRALCVQQDGNGLLQLLPNLFDQVHFHLLLLMGAMGEIQAGNIHAGLDHAGEDLLIGTGRADGADDLCTLHKARSFLSQRIIHRLFQTDTSFYRILAPIATAL